MTSLRNLAGRGMSATASDRIRARRAQAAHADQPFVYDAFLHLLAVGAKPTEAKFLAEAKKLAGAAERELA